MGNSNGSYGSSTTAEEIADGEAIDLRGRHVIVTGSNTGIGKETARVLARRGATVTLACRNLNKANAAAADIDADLAAAREAGDDELAEAGNVDVLQLDLGSLASVRAAAAAYLDRSVPLHILICNAGVMAVPERRLTVDGLEMQMGINHVGHFLFVQLLTDLMVESAPARLVVLSSVAHKMGDDINADNFNSDSGYSAWSVYGRSKLANIIFAKEFNRRYLTQGVSANAVHPGSIAETELSRHMGFAGKVWSMAPSLFVKTIPQGAATTVLCAASPQLEGIGGCYFADCQEADPRSQATDLEFAKWLWDHTEAVILDPPGAPNDDGFGEISGVDPLLAAPPPDLSDSTEMGEG